MTVLLAIDCAFPDALIALRCGDRLGQRSFAPQRSHALRIISELELLLQSLDVAPKDLDRIGVGQGPGSFTGLRVALASAGGLAQASGAELVGFSTFDALPVFSGRILYAFDARSGMVYCGLREGELWLEEPLPRTIAEAATLGRRASAFFGDAAPRYPQLTHGLELLEVPRHADPARALALSAAAPASKPVLPTYKEGAQAQRLYGTPKIGRPLDGDEL